MPLNSLSISVTGVTINPNPQCNFVFYPVDAGWQRRMAAYLGDEEPGTNVFGKCDVAQPLTHRRPITCRNPKGDGACLPRCLSLAIFGTETHHQFLRDAVVDFMLERPLPGETRKRDRSFLRQMALMRKSTTYMRTEQVEAFAYMLDTPIFSCVESRGKYFWQRLPHESMGVNVNNERGIYILCENVHFQLVIQP